MAEEESQPLAYVHETVLKKRKNNEEWAIKRRDQLDARKKRKKEDLKLAIRRPEEFVKEYRDKELDLIRMKQRLKRRKLFSDNIKSDLLFVIRIRGSKDMHPRTRKILNLLRLRHILSGVFVKTNEATLKMLLSVEPFITYGYPSLKNVRELIYKKGCGMIDKQSAPLTNNNVIEQALGKYGIICIEDIVHEIATVGSHFKEVTKFLWPFRLKAPERRLLLKKKPYKDGGDSGNREEHINELIDKLN
ncbi:large ribosomal subunit protein uL30y [Elaeis guineensis]|uniref:60S ribosomal protein L7-2 n=1 Tax=Elaeis guineensis var. tenera TaxID=51953 RepID=A0A6I9R322_ELAGV|nr:60S ribosomal protein L7-2 [Elaeis guineensis]XP_010917040.1 60S ribosomal protein L7-2 [Elaeis guineensis]